MTPNVSTIISADRRTSTQQPFVVWLTGLPASGKSTVGNLLVDELKVLGRQAQLLDSDELRHVLTPEPNYSPAERAWFYSVLVYIADLLVRNDVDVVFAATAHRRIYRQRAREKFRNFTEVYLKCPLKACIERDSKGTYQKALSGAAQSVPGLQVLYEPPKAPGIVIDTQHYTPQECVERILSRLEAFNYL